MFAPSVTVSGIAEDEQTQSQKRAIFREIRQNRVLLPERFTRRTPIVHSWFAPSVPGFPGSLPSSIYWIFIFHSTNEVQKSQEFWM